jgi:hypothetical protein
LRNALVSKPEHFCLDEIAELSERTRHAPSMTSIEDVVMIWLAKIRGGFDCLTTWQGTRKVPARSARECSALRRRAIAYAPFAGAFWCCAVLDSAPNGAAVDSQGLVAPGTTTHATRPSPHASAPIGVAVNSQGLPCPWNGKQRQSLAYQALAPSYGNLRPFQGGIVF